MHYNILLFSSSKRQQSLQELLRQVQSCRESELMLLKVCNVLLIIDNYILKETATKIKSQLTVNSGSKLPILIAKDELMSKQSKGQCINRILYI